MTNEQAIAQLTRVCTRCTHNWVLDRAQEPKVCPRCKNPNWNKEKPAK